MWILSRKSNPAKSRGRPLRLSGVGRLTVATVQDQTIAELTLSKRDIQHALDKKGDGPDLFVVPVKGRRGEESCYLLFSRRWENPNARITTAKTRSETKNQGQSANDLTSSPPCSNTSCLPTGASRPTSCAFWMSRPPASEREHSETATPTESGSEARRQRSNGCRTAAPVCC